MGKMPLGGKEWGSRWQWSTVERGVEVHQLPLRERQQEALEKHNGFAKAGVQVVVGDVEEVPFLLGTNRGRIVQLFRGAGASLIEIFNKLLKGGNFVKKLGTLA